MPPAALDKGSSSREGDRSGEEMLRCTDGEPTINKVLGPVLGQTASRLLHSGPEEKTEHSGVSGRSKAEKTDVDIQVEICGNISVETDGDILMETDGDIPVETDGDIPVETDGEARSPFAL
ncbi:hypothetical protein P4O66_007044 [Electrophorus voltai]|uniref:Uncharacterized protein n=1 Tax=Electrophorus voltai TaxID=2609070 RepID=A0AAD8ZG17_9TELE|nr:hypothetical protein P4O66_007044 [Electrophorus voltai]